MHLTSDGAGKLYCADVSFEWIASVSCWKKWRDYFRWGGAHPENLEECFSLSLMAEWIWELSHCHAEAKASVCACPCISLATCERVWQGHADFQPSVSEQFGEPSSSALLHLGDRVSRRISFRLKKNTSLNSGGLYYLYHRVKYGVISENTKIKTSAHSNQRSWK